MHRLRLAAILSCTLFLFGACSGVDGQNQSNLDETESTNESNLGGKGDSANDVCGGDSSNRVQISFDDRKRIKDGSIYAEKTVSQQLVERSGAIESLNVRVGLEHMNPSDLEIVLEHGYAKEVVWDGAEDPMNDRGVPKLRQSALESFVGEDLSGEWKLTVKDDSEFNVGYLFGWSIEAEIEGGSQGPRTVEMSFENTNSREVTGALPGHEAVTTSAIEVSEGGEVGGVDLSYLVEHESPSDLVVYLAHNGVATKVFDGRNDSASSGRLTAQGKALEAFQGMEASGTWELFVRDNKEFGDGTLREWALDIKLVR